MKIPVQRIRKIYIYGATGRCLAQVIGLLDELNMSKDDYDTLTTVDALAGYSRGHDSNRRPGQIRADAAVQKGHKEVQKVKSSADDEE